MRSGQWADAGGGNGDGDDSRSRGETSDANSPLPVFNVVRRKDNSMTPVGTFDNTFETLIFKFNGFVTYNFHLKIG